MVVESVRWRSNPSTAEQAVGSWASLGGWGWGVGVGEQGMNTWFVNEWHSRI